MAGLSRDPRNYSLPDSEIYTSIGLGILETGEFRRTTHELVTDHLPIYPGFIAIMYKLFGFHDTARLIFQNLLDVLSCILITLMTYHLLPRLALAAGVFAATCLNLIIHASILLPDSLLIFWLSGFLAFGVIYLKSNNWTHCLLAGFFFGAALMTKPVVLYFAPIAVIILWVGSSRRIHILSFCVLLLLFVSPLAIRNKILFDRFGLTTETGVNLVLWHVPLLQEVKDGTPYFRTREKAARDVEEFLSRQDDSELAQTNPFYKDELTIAFAAQELVKFSILDYLSAWGRGIMINVFAPSLTGAPFMVKSDRSHFYETEGSNFIAKLFSFFTHPKNRAYMTLMIPAILVTFVFRLLQFWGLYGLIKDPRIQASQKFLLASFVIYILIITGPLVNASRYRLPLEPILIPLAAMGLYSGIQWLGKKGILNRAWR